MSLGAMKLLFAVLFISVMFTLGKLGHWVAENVGLWPFPILLVGILCYEHFREKRFGFGSQASHQRVHPASQEPEQPIGRDQG